MRSISASRQTLLIMIYKSNIDYQSNKKDDLDKKIKASQEGLFNICGEKSVYNKRRILWISFRWGYRYKPSLRTLLR